MELEKGSVVHKDIAFWNLIGTETELTGAIAKIRAAAAKHGKATGIYIRNDEDLKGCTSHFM